MVLKGFEPSKYLQTILITFLLIETVSFLLFKYADIPLLKLGWLLILALAITAISSLFTLGININNMDKNSIIFILIVVAAVITLIVILPSLVPEIFQIYNPSGIQYSEMIRQSLNAIFTGNIGG